MNKGVKRAFTLIEILIATALLSVVLIGLYSALDTQRRSVDIIKKNLDKSLKEDKIVMTLYQDLLQSDGNITLQKGERDTLCIQKSTNSLYGLDRVKICWVVLKEKDSLARVEGVGYELPLGLEDKVEADIVARGIKLFDIYYEKKKGLLLVVMQELNKEPYSFLLQGIKEPVVKKKRRKSTITAVPPPTESNTTTPTDTNTTPPPPT